MSINSSENVENEKWKKPNIKILSLKSRIVSGETHASNRSLQVVPQDMTLMINSPKNAGNIENIDDLLELNHNHRGNEIVKSKMCSRSNAMSNS
jgi:hypothetical protein